VLQQKYSFNGSLPFVSKTGGKDRRSKCQICMQYMSGEKCASVYLRYIKYFIGFQSSTADVAGKMVFKVFFSPHAEQRVCSDVSKKNVGTDVYVVHKCCLCNLINDTPVMYFLDFVWKRNQIKL
jgi:hypothetical protein